ncbi:uncharacterized protein LOC130997997 [Salvia miltiorrhiza]|uniref:uncharacterized protein LOC130997997 n=1 Tax=Salvia miltiorrhiza TaxID=226208 RepID=UPI0025AC3921|nr:uncharacterized protein LOC130997997 [Salvia miltiorrhiza]
MVVGKDERMDYSLWNPANLHGITPNRACVGKLYSSKTNSWKTVDASICTIVYACGKLYWSTTNDEIEWFDLESEEFGRMELPFGDKYTLVDVEEKEKAGLHFLFEDDSEIGHYRVEVWVMNKDQCWFKVVSLPLVYDDSFHSTGSLLCLGPNGEILVVYFGNLFVYDPRDNLLRTAKNTLDCTRGFVYVESLVSLLPRRNVANLIQH